MNPLEAILNELPQPEGPFGTPRGYIVFFRGFFLVHDQDKTRARAQAAEMLLRMGYCPGKHSDEDLMSLLSSYRRAEEALRRGPLGPDSSAEEIASEVQSLTAKQEEARLELLAFEARVRVLRQELEAIFEQVEAKAKDVEDRAFMLEWLRKGHLIPPKE